ncbi:MAG: hypothetical protein ACLQVX_02670 [Limisphaerales bacterium]
MNALWIAGSLLALAATCPAQQTLARYDWQKLAGARQPTGGTVVQIDGRSALKVSNTNDAPLSVQLLRISAPPITKRLYALVGEVKYEGVQGDGYLELWNQFPPLKPNMPGGRYFSRTLGDSGEMGKLRGTSDWRGFVLPFDWTGGNGPPTRLEFNLHLPGNGTVHVGPINLVEYSGSLRNPMAAPPGEWWPENMAGRIGGIGGATLGCLSGLLAWLASRGKARGFVVGALLVVIGLGGVATLLGLIALGLRQSYAVWTPLLALGVLVLSILPFRLRRLQRHYEELELRRMVSMDVTGR